MQVKIGDKVRFLSSVGGGIVVKQVNKEIVLVREEDGFETPVLARECVVIEQGDARLKGEVPRAVVEEVDFVPELEPETPVVETKEGERITVYLAYVPDNRRNLTEATFDAFMVNDSNYYLMFSYLACGDGKWNTRYAGMVEPNTKLLLESFGREQLGELERVAIQYIAFKKERAFTLKQPHLVEHRIDAVKFYKLHTFRSNDYFDEDALLYPIVKGDICERPLSVDPYELERGMLDKRAADRPTKQPIVKKQPTTQIVEVDLHIHELLDSTAGLSNTDMLNYQLEHFRKVLNQYKGKRGQKIVFIHGKGDGVLRAALLKELRNKYKSYESQDASFREYGFGATMVIIR